MNDKALIINFIRIDEKEITVGATDYERWQWDIDDGDSGADAKTIICAILKKTESGYIKERIELDSFRADPLRKILFSSADQLLETAWKIHDENLDEEKALDLYFGRDVR